MALCVSEPGQVQNGNVIPWPVAPTPTAPTGPIDPRAEDLAMERAESCPHELLRFLATACADALKFDWSDAPTLARKMARGDELKTGELLNVAFNGPKAAKLRALSLLLEQLRADPVFQQTVRVDYLPEAILDIEARDERARDDGPDEMAASWGAR